MDKTYDFVIKPLKIWPPGKHGKYNIFHGIVIGSTKIVNATSLRKVCSQLLSMMNILKDDRAFSLLHQKLPQILVLCFP